MPDLPNQYLTIVAAADRTLPAPQGPKAIRKRLNDVNNVTVQRIFAAIDKAMAAADNPQLVTVTLLDDPRKHMEIIEHRYLAGDDPWGSASVEVSPGCYDQRDCVSTPDTYRLTFKAPAQYPVGTNLIYPPGAR